MPESAAPRPILIALIVASALFMENLDGTVIATALPDMAASFHTGPIHLSLAITAYMLSLAAFIPVSGWVADRFGGKTVFRAAIGVFTLSSLLCAASHSLVELTAARVLQGIGGAMMVPVGRLVLLRSVEKAEMIRAMTYLMVPALLGPILGPPLGGFITTYASWRWIFLLNLPVGLAGMVLVSLFIENVREPGTARLDFKGFVLTALALTLFMAGVSSVSGDLSLACGLMAAGLGFGVFAWRHAAGHPHPLINLRLLRVSTFEVSVVGGMFIRVGIGALPFLLPMMLQVGFGNSAFASGLMTFIAAAGAMVMKFTAGPILRRFGFRSTLVVNSVLVGISVVACAFFTQATPAAVMMAVLLFGGFFRSLQFTSLNAIAYAEISKAEMSSATSFYSMGLGVALAALLLHVSLTLRGATAGVPDIADFRFAFIGIGVIALASVFSFMKLSPDAGDAMSGHRTPVPETGEVPAPAE
jgi:EmrB/QacA subfamily drug resistance transporter